MIFHGILSSFKVRSVTLYDRIKVLPISILSVVPRALLQIPWSCIGNETLPCCMEEKIFKEAGFFHDKEKVKSGTHSNIFTIRYNFKW